MPLCNPNIPLLSTVHTSFVGAKVGMEVGPETPLFPVFFDFFPFELLPGGLRLGADVEDPVDLGPGLSVGYPVDGGLDVYVGYFVDLPVGIFFGYLLIPDSEEYVGYFVGIGFGTGISVG